MGIENALQEAGEKGITIFEYFWDKYPVYVFLIFLGFAILLILALLPRRVQIVQHRYYPQIPVQQLPQQHEVVVQQVAPNRPQGNVIQQEYQQPMQREPSFYEYGYEPRKKPRMTFEKIDLVDNWGFLD